MWKGSRRVRPPPLDRLDSGFPAGTTEMIEETEDLLVQVFSGDQNGPSALKVTVWPVEERDLLDDEGSGKGVQLQRHRAVSPIQAMPCLFWPSKTERRLPRISFLWKLRSGGIVSGISAWAISGRRRRSSLTEALLSADVHDYLLTGCCQRDKRDWELSLLRKKKVNEHALGTEYNHLKS